MSKARSPVYTEAKAKQALADKRYIRIGDKRGFLKLTGAAQIWKKDPSFVYVSDLRVAGKPADIIEQLSALGWSKADLKKAVAAGYTAASQEREDYLTELAAVKGPKKSPRKSTPVSLDKDIAYYADALEKAVAASKTASPKKKAKKAKSPKKKVAKKTSKKATKSPAKKTGTKSPAKKATKTRSKSPAKTAVKTPKGKTSLADKLKKLKAGKVMDVSAFTQKDQVAKVIDKPGAKSKKIVVGKLASDKKNGIKAAAAVLGNAALVAKWETAKAKAAGKGSPRKSASPKKKTSPKKTSSKKTSPRKSSPRKSSPAATLPLSPANSPRSGGLNLPSMPVARVPTIGSPGRSPRL